MPNRTELRALFRSLIDDQNDEIFTDERANRLLFEGAQQAQDLVESLDEKYFVDVNTLVVPADLTQIAISSNTRQILRIIRVDVTPPRDFERLDLRQLIDHRRRYGEYNDDRPAYALRGQNIIYPSPFKTEHTIQVERTFQLSDLTDDNDSWTDLPPAAQRLIPYEAAYIGLIAEDSDARQMSALLMDMRNKAIMNIDQRDRGPRTVVYHPEDGF